MSAIFVAMLTIDSITLIARAFCLALMGFLVMSGAALAHGGGPVETGDHPNGRLWTVAEHEARGYQPTAERETEALPQERLEQAGQSRGEPCSEDGPGGHLAGGCCKVACHSVLAALTADPVGRVDPTSRYTADLADMLVGRSGDRAERPPRHR